MNKPTQPLKESARQNSPHRQHAAVRVALLMLGAAGIYDLYVFYLAFQTGAWQLFTEAGVMLAYSAIVAYSVVLSRRGRSNLGMTLMLGAMQVTILSTSVLIGELGIALAAIVIILTAFIAVQTLPQKQARLALVASFVVAVLTVLLDFYSSVAFEANLSALQMVTSGVAGFLVVIYVIFIMREFQNYTLRTKLLLTFLVVTILPLSILAFINNRSMRHIIITEANQVLLARG